MHKPHSLNELNSILHESYTSPPLKGKPHDPINVFDKDSDDNFFRTEKMKSLANFKIKNPNGIKIRDFDFLNMEIMDGGKLENT